MMLVLALATLASASTRRRLPNKSWLKKIGIGGKEIKMSDPNKAKQDRFSIGDAVFPDISEHGVLTPAGASKKRPAGGKKATKDKKAKKGKKAKSAKKDKG